MSHPALSAAASPKTRLNFLLDEPAPNRLPDRGRARDTVRALSADAMLGSTAPPPVTVSRDWLPGVRAHSADSLSSGNSDVASLSLHRDDSSDGGSLSGGSASAPSPRARTLPGPALLPAAHLLQSSQYGGVFQQYAGNTVGGIPGQTQGQGQQPVVPPLHHAAIAPNVGPLLAPSPQQTGAITGGNFTGGRRAAKTEAQIRERHDVRKMKNRISAAASRDRKKRSFNNLQRSLQEAEMRYAEAKRVIETLTLQLEHARNRLAAGESGNVPVPQDLRELCGGAEFVSPQQLVDLLRTVARR